MLNVLNGLKKANDNENENSFFFFEKKLIKISVFFFIQNY